MRHKLKPGWTRATVLAQFKRYNNGTKAADHVGGACRYQARDGNRCAIGAFIPDCLSHLLTDTGVVEKLLIDNPELLPYMPFDNPRLLASLQGAHDYATGNTYDAVAGWLERFAEDGDPA